MRCPSIDITQRTLSSSSAAQDAMDRNPFGPSASIESILAYFGFRARERSDFDFVMTGKADRLESIKMLTGCPSVSPADIARPGRSTKRQAMTVILRSRGAGFSRERDISRATSLGISDEQGRLLLQARQQRQQRSEDGYHAHASRNGWLRSFLEAHRDSQGAA